MEKQKHSFFCFALLVSTSALGQQQFSTDLDNVGLPATRLSLSRRDSPSATTIITRSTIKQKGYRSIVEIFRDVPGFRVTQSSAGAYYVSYQGYGAAYGRRMAIAVDSVPVLAADTRSIGWYRLPITLDEVEQIVITRGTNGSAYGDNAFLASINIITSTPEDISSKTISGSYASKKSSTAFLRVRDEIENTSFSIAFSNESTDGFDKTEDGEERLDSIDISRLNLASTTTLNPSVRSRVNISYYESKRESVVDVPGQINTRPVEVNNFHVSNKWEFNISREESIDMLLSTSGDDENYGNTACYPAIGFHRISNELYTLNPEYAKSFFLGTAYTGRPLTSHEQDVFNQLMGLVTSNFPASMSNTCADFDLGRNGRSSEAEVSYRLSWGDFSSSVLGLSASRLSATSDTYLGGTVLREYYRLFTETSYILERHTINLGGLIEDASTLSKTEWGIRGSYNYHVNNSQTIRFEASRSFRFPSIMENNRTFVFHPKLHDPVPWSENDFAFALSNPSLNGLEPETIRSYSMGYLATLRNQSISLDSKLFYNEIRDSLSDPINILIPADTVTSDDFETSGIEFSINTAIFKTVNLEATYSYIDNNADSVFERSLHSTHAGSVGIKYSRKTNSSYGIYYYGNSPISGLSYDRYDFIYWTRFTSLASADLQLGIQYLVDKTVGVRDVWPEGEVISSYNSPTLFFGKITFNFY